MMREREVAVRAFFFELREANHMVSGVEKSPRYVLLPSGIYANRVFLVGIMTGTEKRENGVKAYMSDPTSDITFFSGRFNPEITSFLNRLETPCICALSAKLGIFETQDGARFISLRPERIGRTDEGSREYWTLTTARDTLRRLESLKLAKEGGEATQASKDAIGHYNTNMERYYNMVFSALKTLISTKESASESVAELGTDLRAIKSRIMDILGNSSADVSYEELTKTLGEYDESVIEEALNELMDEGAVFERSLGRFRPA